MDGVYGTPQFLHLSCFNQSFTIELHENDEVVHPNGHYTVLEGDGSYKRYPLSTVKSYRGPVYSTTSFLQPKIVQQPIGYAHVTFGEDFIPTSYHLHSRQWKTTIPSLHATFTITNDTIHLLPFHDYQFQMRDVDYKLPESSSIVAYRDSDRRDTKQFLQNIHKYHAAKCGHDHHVDLFTRAGQEALPHNPLLPRAAAGCPQQVGSKMLYMSAVADCTFIASKGGVTQARDAILQIWNQVNTLYASTFNIQVGLVDILMMPSPCPTTVDSNFKFNQPCSSSYTITQRLSDFSAWRGQQNTNVSQISGLYHLVTTCATGAQVGVAWLNTLCQKSSFAQTDASFGQVYVSGTAVSASNGAGGWRIVAHETGHNFGSTHDCVAQTCPATQNQCCACSSSCTCNSQFIMNPWDVATATGFSDCSQTLICNKVASLGSCLTEPGKYNTATSFVCGNGIKEGDEECDAGGKSDPCCTSECKLTPGAKCSGNDACCLDCQPKANGTLCRGSKGSCDLPEYCNGVNGTCPRDSWIPNGSNCNATDSNGNMVPAKCANGVCTSRDLQCKARDPSISLVNGTSPTGGLVTGECTQFGSGCALYCQSRFGECLTFNDYYAAGTACGQNGVCQMDTDGTMICSNMSPFDAFIYWASKNLFIVIPCAIAVVLMLIAITTWCLRSRKKQVVVTKEVVNPPSPTLPPARPPASYLNSGGGYSAGGYGQAGYVTEFPMQPLNAQQSAYNARISRVYNQGYQTYPTRNGYL